MIPPSRGPSRWWCAAAIWFTSGADLFRIDPHEIHAVPVVLTMMDGRITHDAR